MYPAVSIRLISIYNSGENKKPSFRMWDQLMVDLTWAMD